MKRIDDRLIGIAEQVLDKAEAPDRALEQIPGLELKVRSAEALHRGAKLTLEEAKHASEEYRKVTSVREKAESEANVKISKDELERARHAVPVAKERLARIKEVLKGESAWNVEIENKYTLGVTIAELNEQKARFAVDMDDSKKSGLVFGTQPILMQYQAQIEKAHSEELAEQAKWDMAKSRMNRAKKTADQRELADVEKRLISIVLAIPIQQAIEAKLDEFVKGVKPDDTSQAVLRDLTEQLEALIDRAEGEQAAARFARLKPQFARPPAARLHEQGYSGFSDLPIRLGCRNPTSSRSRLRSIPALRTPIRRHIAGLSTRPSGP